MCFKRQFLCINRRELYAKADSPLPVRAVFWFLSFQYVNHSLCRAHADILVCFICFRPGVGHEIKGKTLGLLGFGAIARLVAEKLMQFDAEVIACDLYPDEMEAEAFDRMKDDAYIINCARGSIIDTDALCRALKNGTIAGAALDAFEAEPLTKDAEILACKNVICTPHMAVVDSASKKLHLLN